MQKGMEEAFARTRQGQTPKPPEKPSDKPPEKPAEKPAEKAVETPAKEPAELKVPEFSTKSGDVHFKAEDFAKAKQAQYDRGRQEAEKELRAQMVAKAEYEAAIKERDEYRTRLQSVALEHDPQFQKEFNTQTSAAIKMAKDAVGPELAGQVESLLRMENSDWKTKGLDEIVGSLSPSKQMMLGAAVARLAEVDNERQARLAEAPKVLQQREAEQQATAQQRVEYSNRAFSDAWAAATDPDNGIAHLLTEKDGDTEHNQKVADLRRMAKHIMGIEGRGATTTEVARASIQAVLYKPLAEDNLRLLQENEQLKEQLTKLRNGKPNLGDGPGKEVGEVDTKPATLSGMMEGARKLGLLK